MLRLLAALVQVATCDAARDTLSSRIIDSVAKAEMAALGAPGVAAVAVRNGCTVFSRSYGVRSIETRDTMTVDAVMRVGSVTKMVTGLTALVLASEGKLNLDEPISRRVEGLSPSIGALTMRQLLSHSAGLWNEAAASGPRDDDALGKRVRAWGSERFFAPAGDVYSYSSPGYWLAGHVIERVTGLAYADAVARIVFAPLGMTSAAFRMSDAITRPIAIDHVRANGAITVLRPFPDDATTWPSGSMFASARDLAKLALAIANDGMLDGEQLLPRSAVELLKTQQVETPGGSCGYTFGLSRCVRGTEVSLSHAGFRAGSGSTVTILPGKASAVIILANGPGAIMRRTERVLLRQLSPAAASTPVQEPPKPAAFPDSLLGKYAQGADTISLVRDGSAVRMQLGAQRFDAQYMSSGIVRALGASGGVEGEFHVVRGRTAGLVYLHEGLSAFRRVP